MISLLLQILCTNVLAQEDPVEQPTLTFEELGWIPPFQVGAFIDRADSGDCDRIDARYGRCIELVDFYRSDAVWRAVEDGVDPMVMSILYPGQAQLWVNADEKTQQKWQRKDKKTALLLAELYAQTWEDIVYRWKESTDPLAIAMIGDGFKVTPDTSDQWETTYPGLPAAMGRPKAEAWLEPEEWVQPIVPLTNATINTSKTEDPPWQPYLNPKSYFNRVQHAVPKRGKVEPVPSIVLSGRFADRLAVNGRLHDYDIMDAEPVASGPFFEQIYPYQTIYQGQDSSFIPLTDFRYQVDPVNGAVPTKVINIASLEEARIESDKQFNRFYRMVGAQVMQFAMQDYTANHMRILTTLNTMRSPPGELGTITGISGNINASSLGQTDSAESQTKRIKSDAYALSGGFSLNYQKLPDLLTVKWIERLASIYLTQPGVSPNLFYRELSMTAQNRFGESLVYPLNSFIEGLSVQELNAWIEQNLLPGRDGNVLLSLMYQMTLQMLMDQVVPEDMVAQEETWLLMDHFNYSVMSNMDTTVGVRISPTDIEGMASGKWESVLSDHYFSTQKIDQGLGAIDPTAVCTMGTRLDALTEPTIGAVYVDQIFSGADIRLQDGLTNDVLLWNARDQLPFLMFDNPVVNDPSVQRLVGLPDGEALYRVRWTVWSGWHFLWGVEDYKGEPRLTLKTGAICDNMVLANPDLVPTIVRAGFLEDSFYPTEPARASDKKINDNYPSMSERQEKRRKSKPAQPKADRQDIMNTATKTVNRTKSTVNSVEGTVEQVEAGELTQADTSAMAQKGAAPDASQTSTLEQLQNLRTRKPASIEVSETVRYFRRLARTPMEKASAEKGLLLMLQDLDQPERAEFLRDGMAHTPYARGHKLQGADHIQGAAWAIYFDKEADSKDQLKASPNYIPRPNYVAQAVTPSFKRSGTTDTTFVGDVGLFPYRRSFYTCNPDVNVTSLSSVKTCDPDKRYQATTDGISVGTSSIVTKWFRDDPRLAYEVGLEVHVDVLHAGKSWFHEQGDLGDVSVIVDRLNGRPVQSSGSEELLPSYSWSIRPQTGASFGIRHALDPMPLNRPFRSTSTWGAMGASGDSTVRRAEWGMRGAMLVGPSFNGMEATLVAEAWAAGLLRSATSDWAHFSPYHPIWNGGVFVRYQRGGLLVPAEEAQMFELMYSDTFLVGWRTHFRLPEPRPE